MKNRVVESIANRIPAELEAYSNEDMVIFRPRFFVAGENQFDCYHFTMPKVPMPKLVIDSKEMTVYTNSIFPTNPGQKLKVAMAKNESNVFNEVKYVSIFIEKEKLQDFSKVIFNKSQLCFRNENNPIDYSLLESIRLFCYESENKQAGFEFILESIVDQIAINILRQLKSDMPDMHRRYTCTARNEIRMAIDFLWENINMKFSLKDLCKTVNLSPYYFLRLFKDTTGQTPYEYYMDVKVMKGLEYLKSGEYSITEVSYMLGFSSHSHFTSIFKKKLGTTPSQYMKSR